MGKSEASKKVKQSKTWRPWVIQLSISMVIALIGSALPFVFALSLDKSSLPLAQFMTWYSLFPPVVIFLVALALNLKTRPWLRALGLVWVNVSLWFLLQYLFSALGGLSMLVRLMSLPVMLAGNAIIFLIAGVVFLAAGIVLYIVGRSATDHAPVPSLSWSALAMLVVIAVLVVPLFIALVSNPAIKSASQPAVPTKEQIFGWTSDVYNLGERRPGSEADHKAIAYLEEKLRSFGLTDVRVEKSKFDYWEPVKWSLTLQPAGSAAWEAETYFVPYSGPTSADGVTAEVAYLGNISSPKWQDVKGKIILVDIPSADIAWDQMKMFSYMAYEPENALKGVSSPYPVGWMLKYIDFYKQAETRHPAGIIGILRNYPAMGKFTYYAPYDGELRPIPSMYLLPAQGDKLKEQVSAGKASAKIVLQANVALKGGESANVYAVLPGRSASTLLIHSHHDAPFRSGVEDSSGVGMVLGLAKYYSQVPQSERPFTLVFLFTGGHMAGAFTDRDFIARHSGDILSHTLYDIAIEHIADDYMPPPYQSTGGAQPRGVFITENPVTVGLYATSVVSAQASRTLLFPTGTPLGVPTDASPFQKAGTPIVSLISGPTWLFDDDDTLDRVAKDQLVPLTRMYIDFASRLGATPEALLRMNLTAFVLGLLIIIFSPLAAMFLAFRKR